MNDRYVCCNSCYNCRKIIDSLLIIPILHFYGVSRGHLYKRGFDTTSCSSYRVNDPDRDNQTSFDWTDKEEEWTLLMSLDWGTGIDGLKVRCIKNQVIFEWPLICPLTTQEEPMPFTAIEETTCDVPIIGGGRGGSRSAITRTETRGSHFMNDYPAENKDDWRVNIQVWQADSSLVFEQVQVPDVDPASA